MNQLKIFIIICFLCIAKSSFAQEWQWHNTRPFGSTVIAVEVLPNNQVFICISSGGIYFSSNGGLTWEPRETNVFSSIHDIAFSDINNGWMVGEEGKIFHSNDGGYNWSEQVSNVTGTIKDVEFTDSLKGWAVGNYGTVLRTIDGGNTWTSDIIANGNRLDGIEMVNENVGYICGIYGIVQKTLDGGETWNQVSYPYNAWLNDICFISEQVGAVAGDDGQLYSTNDGGQTWTQHYHWYFDDDYVNITMSPDGEYIYGLSRYDNKASQIHIPTNTISSCDFQRQSPSTYGVVFFVENNLFALTSGDIHFSKFHTLNEWELLSCRSFDNIISMDNMGDSILWVATKPVSNSNKIAKSTNGGESWDLYDMNMYRVNDIHFVDSLYGFAIGRSYDFARTSDGGETWESIPLPSVYSIYYGTEQIHFWDNQNGITVGGRVLKTNDGGETWNEFFINAPGDTDDLRFFFLDENIGWLCGDHSFISKTIDGGETWTTQMYEGNNYSFFNDIFFIDELNGWVVGDYGQIRHTTNGGQTWNIQEIGFNQNIHDIHFLNSTDGWFANGSIYYTTDAGVNWIRQDNKLRSGAAWLNPIHDNLAWAWGYGGRLIKYSLDPVVESQVITINNMYCIGDILPDGTVATENDVDYIVGDSCNIMAINTIVHQLPSPEIMFQDSILSVSEDTFITYQWMLDGLIIEGADSINFSPNVSGTYALSATDIRGCNNLSNTISVDIVISTSINNVNNNSFEIFPNPASSKIVIQSKNNHIFTYKILDINGKVIKNGFPEISSYIDISTIPNGIYIIQLQDSNHSIFHDKLIISR